MPTYKILSLDGGGCWSILQILALQAIYGGSAKGYDVLKEFDLVAASSGGSITFGALTTNKPLDQILKQVFEDPEVRKGLFAPPKWFNKKFSTSGKHAALRSLLSTSGGLSLAALFDRIQAEANSSPEFLICAFDCERSRAEFFRSGHSRAASTKRVEVEPTNSGQSTAPSLLDIVQASTTGPAHQFDAPAVIGKSRFWDSAVAGLYNPILAAVTEARANDKRPEDIRVLSLGTGTVQLPVWEKGGNATVMRAAGTLAHDPMNLAASMFYDPPDSATFVAHVLLGQPLPHPGAKPPVSGNVIRMNPVIGPVRKNGKWVAPDGMQEPVLAKLALKGNAVDSESVKLIKDLGRLWIEGEMDNQPIRANRDYVYEVGHKKFAEARDDWIKKRDA